MEENTFTWRKAVNYGLLSSVIMLYFCMIGMVEIFNGRDLIGGFLNMSHLLLYGGPIVLMLFAIRRIKLDGGNFWTSTLTIGALSPVLPILLVLLNEIINRTSETFVLRDVFISVSPTLVGIITFNLPLAAGLAVFFAVTIAVVVLTAAFTRLPDKLRTPLTTAVVYVLSIGVFSELIIQILNNPLIFGRLRLGDFIFTGKAIDPIPAVILFIGFFALFTVRGNRKPKEVVVRKPKPADSRRQLIQLGLVVLGLALAPWILGTFLSQALFEVGRFVLMGLGLNIVVGYAGLLDLGYVAFFAFGAYVMGVMTTGTDLNAGGGVVNFWMALPIAVLVSVLFGVILGFPVLRLRGDYLAIVTLGFGEIIRLLALSDWLAPIIGGAQGILKIPNPVFFGINFNSPQTMYYLMVLGALLVGFVSIRLRDSRLGRQWMAMREDEDVAEAMGINLVQTKLLAFAIGAGFSGLAGAIFAARLGTIFPHSFSLLISINALALIIVGGLGSIPGVIVGAIVLVGLPELLREFTEYRLLMYGILLIVMMLLKPEGFLPAEVFKRELHAGEDQPEFSGAVAD
jgi:branched-chain amino acid transport system permease protein